MRIDLNTVAGTFALYRQQINAVQLTTNSILPRTALAKTGCRFIHDDLPDLPGC
nr:hypothetical protein [Escherichia coli]